MCRWMRRRGGGWVGLGGEEGVDGVGGDRGGKEDLTAQGR
jgi:hypothetical protein